MSPTTLFQILPIVFLAHCLEEWRFGFPEWAVRRFGPITTRRFYFFSHIPLVLTVVFVSLLAANLPESSVLRFLVLTIQTVVFTNGIFHVLASLIFREYSPGVVTSILFTFPFSWIFYDHFHATQEISTSEFAITGVLGAVISILIIYSLTWRRVI